MAATLLLDQTVITSFGLLPTGKMKSNDTRCILGVLNKCKSNSGEQLLRSWLLAPLADLDEINKRLDIVEFFVENSEVRRSFHRELLSRIPDLTRLKNKFDGKSPTAKLNDCHSLYVAVSLLPQFIEALQHPRHEIIGQEFIQPIQRLAKEFEQYQEFIKSTVDTEHPNENREYVIRADYNDELNELSQQLWDLRKQVESELNECANDLQVDKQKVLKIECTNEGYLIKVSKTNEKFFRNKSKYQPFGKIKNDGARFITTKLREINADYTESKKAYDKAQAEIANEVIRTTQGYMSQMEELAELLAQLDVLVGLAVAAVEATNSFVKPKMLPKGAGRLVLKQVRHPSVDANRSDYIPNDISFDQKDKTFYILTGPNMGGKSTYILSVGICVLLAQIGSYVPAEQAEISVVDGIYTRVGAGDQQLQGASTFMAEMTETTNILKAATKDSLVIIDELGRGTSTFDGFGLAWAISEHIARDLGAFCLFATHYHELTELSRELSSVGNLHVSAQSTDNELMMLYQVRPGSCDQSFGVHVAKLARFPEPLIRYAQSKLEQLEGQQCDRKLLDGGSDWLEKLQAAGSLSDHELEQFLRNTLQVNVN